MRFPAVAAALIPLLVLSSCAPAPAVDVTRLPRGVQASFEDVGPSSARAEVRASLVDALSTEEDQLSRTPEGLPRGTVAVRRARLAAVESTGLAERDLRAMALLGPPDVPFRSARFVVIDEQGTAVRGERAKAYVLGRTVHTRWDGSIRTGPTWQVKALLRRDARARHGWVLTRSAWASNEQG